MVADDRCGAETRTGGSCRRRTPAGARCIQHPAPPPALSPGEQFRADVVKVYGLTAPELRVLEMSCATLDAMAMLQTQLDADGTTVTGSMGQTVLHPAIPELRQQRLALGRMLGQLALPDPETGETLATVEQLRAKTAGQERWRQQHRREAT